ncbi:MAG TPA: FAD-dependent oxidoreductase [Candidatus Methylacidiphilales bacterium]
MSSLVYYRPVAPGTGKTLDCDLCIYGGTSGGIAAAVAAKRLGLRVVLVEGGVHLGGMTSGGLSLTDIGNKQAIGGLAREFYRRVGKHYGTAEHWRFEPRVAAAVFADWMSEEKIEAHTRSFLSGVEVRDGRIVRLRTESGLEVSARFFLDATYEGDLLAAAGVSHAVGRESNALYGETLNGAQIHDSHQFDLPVDPYVVEGDPGSGLLPGIEAGTPVVGQGDHRLQAYNFRLCLCEDPANQLPIEKPEGYDRSAYELLARYCRAGHVPSFIKFDALVRGKADVNNMGAFSTDCIGFNYRFPAASYAEREAIFQAHVAHIKGLLWFWKQDPDVPAAFREPFGRWGWAKDEFVDYGGFSPALYVREGRRMVSDVVMTEHHCRGEARAEDSAGLAAYTMDSHNCRRFVQDGRVLNEGDVQAPCGPPYPVSYRALVPKDGECANLFAPFCLSASHIAFGSIRMEPVFMVLAESCVHAALLALEKETPVQRVPYEDLRARLLAAGQVLDPVAPVRDPQAGE